MIHDYVPKDVEILQTLAALKPKLEAAALDKTNPAHDIARAVMLLVVLVVENRALIDSVLEANDE